MRTILLITLCLALCSIDALAQGRRGRGRDPASVTLHNFTFKRVEFVAPSLESVWGEYGVYLPKGYDDAANANKRYPWAIWLHGMNGNYQRFHFGGAEVMDKLLGDGKIPPMVFVAATCARRTLYLNGERSGDFEDLILRDLIGDVEKNYRVSTKRADRALMGCSIGGYGALKIAMRHPEVFGTVVSHSGAIFPADPGNLPASIERQRQFTGRQIGIDEIFGQPIDKKLWAAQMPMAMVVNMKPADLEGLRIYFDAGTDDRYGFAPPNQELHDAMQKHGFKHSFEMVEGGGHAWGSGFVQQQLEKSLPFIAAGFSK